MIFRTSIVLAALIASATAMPLRQQQRRDPVQLKVPGSTTCVTIASTMSCTYIDTDGTSYLYSYPLLASPKIDFGNLIGLSTSQINTPPTGLSGVGNTIGNLPLIGGLL